MPSFSPLVTAVLGGVLVVVGLFLLDRLARWAERRGWIDYRRPKGSAGSVGNALVEDRGALEPGRGRGEEAEAEAPEADTGLGRSSTAGGATPEEPAAKR